MFVDVIEVEVGIGTFGKVFRCRDKKYDSAATGSATSRTGSFVAIKVVRNIPKYVSSAEIEARVLDDIYKAQKEAFGGSSSSRWRPCVKMYDHFRFRGMPVSVYRYTPFTFALIEEAILTSSLFSDHYCMVFECLGPSLYDVIKMRRHRGLPLVMVKHIARYAVHIMINANTVFIAFDAFNIIWDSICIGYRQLLLALDFMQSMDLVHTGTSLT
jgi:serine/threonine protein kinase